MTSAHTGVDIDAAIEAVSSLLKAFGVDPDHPHLRQTPHRVAMSFAELFGGIGVDQHAPLRRGDPVPSGIDLIGLRDIEFRSICSHHLLPFSGVVHVAYIPTTHIVGIGSIVRSLEILSTRPQLQEHLCQELADALEEGASAAGALVVIEARHSCIADRGPREAASRLITTAASGSLRAPARRAEAMRLFNACG